MTNTPRSLLFYLGILFLSFATLGLEIALVRVISVSLWHHFAYMVISMALLGFGAGGSFLSVFPGISGSVPEKRLSLFAFLFSVATLLCFMIIRIPFDPYRLSWDRNQLLYTFLYYLFLSIPFFFSGLFFAVLFKEWPEKSGLLYFFNLLGSAFGCLVIPFLFSPLKGEGVLLFIALTGITAFFLFSYGLSKPYRRIAPVFSALLLGLFFLNPSFFTIPISPYKALSVSLTYKDSRLLKTLWNSFSKIDVIESPAVRYAPGLSLSYKKPLPPQIGITTDGENLNSITRYTGKREECEFTDFLTPSLAYHLVQAESQLIIGSSGGIDVLGALYHGVPMIDALESNSLIIRLLRKDFREFSGGIYTKARMINEEGRSYIRSTKKRYDLIHISLADNPSASSSGLYSLKESYLYTVEAFRDFYRHLNSGGIFTATRYLIPPPRQGVRLVSIAKKALEELNVPHPENHMTVVRSWGTITLLLKKDPFSRSDIEIIRDFCSKRGFDTVYFPGIRPEETNTFNRFEKPFYFRLVSSLLKENNKRVLDKYIFDLSAVTDNNPFFFHFLKWNRINETYRLMGEKWQLFLEGGYLLPVILFQALFAGIILIFLPLLFSRKIRLFSGKNISLFIYFLALGLGFMFIEIILIEKFILFLGHPSYSLSVILFSVLLFSGIGSFLSEKVSSDKAGRKKSLIFILFTLICTIFLYTLYLNPLMNAFLGYQLPERVLLSVLIIAPLALLMGMPFPLGIKLTGLYDKEVIPISFAINGVFSVFGSILSMIMALSLGFQSVLLLSSFIYLAALLSVLKRD
jgi:spermidine synthase